MPCVTLISYTPDPVKTVAAAARLCYSKEGIGSLFTAMDDKKAEEFVRMLASLGHESPFEHASFTFGIEGVSRALLAQITRHRIASYSVQSQRYVEKASFEAVVPPEISRCPAALEEFERCMRACQSGYESIAAALEAQHKKDFISQGLDPEKAGRQARKMALEDARFVLPNACDTRMLLTMNARSLGSFFTQRLCSRAQWEIRAVAREMYLLVRECAPLLFERCGPACVRGACPEGAMSCKRAAEMRRVYGPGSAE